MEPLNKVWPFTLLGILGLMAIIVSIFAILHTVYDIFRYAPQGPVLGVAILCIVAFVLQMIGGVFTMFLGYELYEKTNETR